MIELSAIIATYNRGHYLTKILESIKIQSLSKEKFEIIIVNNNCTDNTGEICEEFHLSNPGIPYKYRVEKKQGLSFGRNRGITESSGNYLTFLDDDAYLDKDFFKTSLEFLKSHPDVAAIGGRILLHYETKKPGWITPFLSPLFGYFNLGDKIKTFPKNNFPRGSNMTFNKHVFEKYGLFNTDLGRKGVNLIAGEEKDMFFRIYSGNEKIVYVPEALVYHFVPYERTTAGFIKKQAIGTGHSERARVNNEGKVETLKRGGAEIKKWVASIVLFFFYCTTFHPSKGIMLLRFRYWVTKGFFSL